MYGKNVSRSTHERWEATCLREPGRRAAVHRPSRADRAFRVHWDFPEPISETWGVPAGFDGIQEETAIHRIPGPTMRHGIARPAMFDAGSNRPVEWSPRTSWPPFKTPDPGRGRAGYRLFVRTGSTGRAVAAPAGRPRQPDAA